MVQAERPPFPGWPPREMIVPFVLLAVSMQRAHGYLIEEYLRSLGLFGLEMSTLYRTLRLLEKEGLLHSTWEAGEAGPARRVYSLTDAGLTWLEASSATMNAYREVIDRFFGLRATPDAPPEERPRKRRAARSTDTPSRKEEDQSR